MQKEKLGRIDETIRQFLVDHVKIMPLRWKKFIANYYTDAVVRKLYWGELHVHMGEGSFANLGMCSDATEEFPVLIGDHVSIAPNVTFITISSPNNSELMQQIPQVKNRLMKSGTIVVENDVWIGAGVTILPGVRVGSGSVIGAGAVVTEDVEPHSVYAGLPARKIRSLCEEQA